MSFDSNPFFDMTLCLSNQGLVHWRCDSCGGQSSAFMPTTEFAILRKNYDRHLRESHGMKPADVADWSHLVD